MSINYHSTCVFIYKTLFTKSECLVMFYYYNSMNPVLIKLNIMRQVNKVIAICSPHNESNFSQVPNL